MTFFPVRAEPAACPRLAGLVAWGTLMAAAMPWMANCPAALAFALSGLLLACGLATLFCVPGPHRRLRALHWLPGGPELLFADGSRRPAGIGSGTRVYTGLVVLDLRLGSRRTGWLLPRGALPAAEFRRLKARLRLAC